MRGEFSVKRTDMPGVIAVAATSSLTFARHTHDDYGIGVVIAGAQTSASGRGPVEAEAGDLITVNPGEIHDGVPLGGARSWRMLYFSPDVVDDLLAGEVLRGEAPKELKFPVLRAKTSARHFLSLYRLMTDPLVADPLAREEHLVALFAILIEDRAPADSGAAPDIGKAMAMIADDPVRNRPLAEIGDALGMSRFQALRAFRKACGFTPSAYQAQKRCDLARRLILGGAALSEAAYASGFSDQSHMTRAFVQRYGFTPGALAAA
jgi:AraC-like DNA-binding protein